MSEAQEPSKTDEGQSRLTVGLGKDRPDFVIELPDGDARKTHIWFTEKRTDGKWHISISVDDDENLRNEVAELRRIVSWHEARKKDAITAMTLVMPNLN